MGRRQGKTLPTEIPVPSFRVRSCRRFISLPSSGSEGSLNPEILGETQIFTLDPNPTNVGSLGVIQTPFLLFTICISWCIVDELCPPQGLDDLIKSVPFS